MQRLVPKLRFEQQVRRPLSASVRKSVNQGHRMPQEAPESVLYGNYGATNGKCQVARQVESGSNRKKSFLFGAEK